MAWRSFGETGPAQFDMLENEPLLDNTSHHTSMLGSCDHESQNSGGRRASAESRIVVEDRGAGSNSTSAAAHVRPPQNDASITSPDRDELTDEHTGAHTCFILRCTCAFVVCACVCVHCAHPKTKT